MALEVAAGEAAAAVVHVADVEDHLGPGGFGGGIGGVGVGDDEIDAFGFAVADLVGLHHELAVFGAVVDGAEHDHASAVGELSVGNGVVLAHVNGVFLEAEGAAQPVDGGDGVAIAETGNECGARLCCHARSMLQPDGERLGKIGSIVEENEEMNYLWLAGAILSEVIGTSSLKASEGFTRLLPSVVVVIGYGLAFYCLSQTLKTMPVGVAYAIWSGLGTVLIALVGLVLYKQKLDSAAIVGMALIIAGVLVMNLLSKSAAH